MKLRQLLIRPIPDMTHARHAKAGYRHYPLNVDGTRNDEPLVDVAIYGIAGQSYYSRANAATEEPVLAAQPQILVRQSMAEKLAAINYELQQSEDVAALLGGNVELYIEEGIRPYAVQKQLYEEVFPQRIREQYPSWNEAKVFARRDQLIARPTNDTLSPAPHSTGAAIDLTLRYITASQEFTKGTRVEFGHKKADMGNTADPDCYEHKTDLSKIDVLAQRNRRIFYWVMRGALLNDDSGLEVNPTEFWHWSYGDQMWAALRQAPQAFFGVPPDQRII